MHEDRHRLLEAFSLSDRVAVVTGGASGLGYAMAAAFRAAGAQVVITGRRADVLEEAVATLGPGTFAFEQDVRNSSHAIDLVQRIGREVGPPTILVNNAGIHLKQPLCSTTYQDFYDVLDTHVGGSFSMTQAVIPEMRRGGYGSVIFIASMTSLIGMPNAVAYSAAKAGYVGMVRALAVELGPENIRVNGIAPGWIETPMLNRALDGDPSRRAKILSRTPMDRFGSPLDIGWCAVYLSSPCASFINGVILPVDGGASIGF